MAAKTKNKEVEEAAEETSASKSILGGILKDHKKEHFNFIERKNWACSTGSLILDEATGLVRPSLWRLAGTNNCGKTPQMLEIIRNIFLTQPKSKAVWFLAEGRGLSEENKVRCGLKFVYDFEEWDEHTVFVLECNVFELFIKVVKDLVFDNPEGYIYAFVVDSVDGLTLRKDNEKEITEDNKVAGVPSLSKKMMQSLSLGMFKFGHFMGLISQVTSEIKLDKYAAKTPERGIRGSGGNALLHGSDIILQYEGSYNGDFILDSATGKFNDGKSKTLGQNVRVTLIKATKEEFKKTSFSYPIKYGRKPSGVWVSREIPNYLMRWDLCKANGTWITFDQSLVDELRENGFDIPEKVQGMEKLNTLIDSSPDLTNYLHKKINKILLTLA